MSKSTKTGTLSQEFLRAAAGSEESALAYQLLSAFGISLAGCYDEVNKAITARDTKIIVLMMVSGVQVRGNVVFVGPNYGDIRTKYPSLVIEGSRPQTDVFNFGALHVCGHILAAMTKHPIGSKISSKAGNCAIGQGFTESEAGKINKEIFANWGPQDISVVSGQIASFKAGDTKVLDDIVANFEPLSKAFKTKLNPAATVGGQSSGKS